MGPADNLRDVAVKTTTCPWQPGHSRRDALPIERLNSPATFPAGTGSVTVDLDEAPDRPVTQIGLAGEVAVR